MTRKLKYTSLLLSLLAVFAACSDEVVDAKDPDQGKSPIELSVGGIDTPSSQTRTVITDGTDKTKQAFDENTSLYMLMKSEDITDGSSNPALVTRTIMFALPQTDSSKDYSEVNYSASNEDVKFVRYWEDSYSRSSALSILAVCTPGMGPGGDNTKSWTIGSSASYANEGWSTTNGDASYPTVKWPIGNENQINGNKLLSDQSLPFDGVSFIKNQDLCFSNNIGNHGSNDHRLKYDFSEKRFPRPTDTWDDNTYKTRMIFYHALSKLTFKIKEGSGFATGKFKFDGETNIKLTNFYNSGTFNMEEGEFINTSENPLSTGAIEKIYNRPSDSFTSEETSAGYKYILDALVIPGTDMDNATTTGVDFFIDNNEYKLTMKQLYDAIINNLPSDNSKTAADYFDKNGTEDSAPFTKLKAGVHYVFTFTVGKTKIEKITAQLVPWEEVTSIDFDASNARIELELLDKGEAQQTGVKFYRALNYKEGGSIDDAWEKYDWLNKQYETDVATYGDDHWTTTNWVWESNRHFYHFRALMPDDVAVENNGDTDPNPTFNLQSAKVVDANSTYNDIKWGAPFKQTTSKLTYSKSKGFDGKGAEASEPSHQIYKAIGPTKETITLVSFHMMSEVTIKIKTTTQFDNVDFDGSDDAGFTTVELLNCYQNASVRMGDGLVSPTGDKATIEFNSSLTNDESTQTATWGMVPQSLEGVQLRVTTADGNQYFVDMGKIKVNAASVTNVNLANPYHVITEADVDNTNIKPADVGKCIANYWYPDYKYSYTFTLTKQGIKDLVATIVDWETVTAEDEIVQIQ